MPAPTDRTPVQTARAALDDQRRQLIDALLAAEEAGLAFDDVKRGAASGTAAYQAAQTAKNNADTTLANVRAGEQSAKASLQTALSNWLSNVTPEDDLNRLEATAPIVLFPVRIETRFEPTVLRVRIYPDEIFLNRHEKALTRDEYAAGKKYYQDLNTLGNEPARWREIIGQFGVERSAYILRIMLPTFGGPGGTSSLTESSSSCGGTITGALNESLTFPTDIQFRSGTWTRPAEAVLPDRWVVTTIRAGARRRFILPAILEPLAITFDPNLPASKQNQISRNASYSIDDDIRWTVDFQRALQVGMACEIPLSAAEAAPVTGGFDRLYVVGVKSSMTALDTSRAMEELLDAHHYTRGLAIVRQGTPTNNTKDSPTPFPPADEGGARSFEIERRRAPLDRKRAHHCLLPDTDGYALTRQLGVPSGVAANIDRGYEHEIARSFAMGRVIWPATYGYFLRFLMAPVVKPADEDKARSYFASYVSGRGPAPAFRVGAVPYGVLPITSIARWQSKPLGTADEQTVENAIIDPLRRLLPIWADQTARVPQLTPDSLTPDVDLVRVLTTLPSPNEVRDRGATEELVYYNIFGLNGWNWAPFHDLMVQLTRDLFTRLGHPEWQPRIGQLAFNEQANRLDLPFIPPPAREDAPLGPEFINGYFSATLHQLITRSVPNNAVVPNMFELVLNRATLLEYARVAGTILTSFVWNEFPLWGISGLPATMTIGQLFATVGEPARDQATEFRNALARLIGTPSADVERLFTESLDLASRRIDAWATAFANRRIQKMRDAQQSSQLAPVGDFMGGYGWLENLRPIARQTTTAANGITAELQPGNGGYIHAPSSSHAAAAAILRSAQMSAAIEAPGKYTIDLSSRRVRIARQVVEEVRNRQPLGAVLGYRFERALHEGHPGVADLDKFRFVLRGLFPLVAGKNGVDTAEPAERIAARNVVDGLKMLRAFRANKIDFAGNPNLPKPGTPAHVVILAEFAVLESLLDAVADLMTAEGAFQLARGNVAGAPPSLENLIAGRSPPDTLVARTPRGGTGITHRVAMVFPSDATPTLPAHWPTGTPRAAAEPVLNAWLGQLIGDPDNVTCRVTFADSPPASLTVKLSDLGLAPLDLLALARKVTDQPAGSALEERILTAALGSDASKVGVTVAYDRPASATDLVKNRTFPEALEIARAMAAVFNASRALEIADLLPPGERDEGLADAEAGALLAANEVAGRAAAALAGLTQIATGTNSASGPSLALALDGVDPANVTSAQADALRAALVQAALFAPEHAFPQRLASGSDLALVASAVKNELTQRLKAVPAAPAGPLAKDVLAAAQATLTAIFGAGFVALPDVEPPRGDELALSLGARASLLGSDDSVLDRYLAQATTVQAPLRSWRKLQLYARAFGADKPRLDVAQLPFVPGETWLGLPFGDAPTPEDARSGLLLFSNATTLDPALTWRGILVDHWTEIIPRRKERTSIAFHYDGPRAAAPQAVLVAAPAQNTGTWQFADLQASLEETMDLAKIRAVDAELLPIGQLIPLTLFAFNPLTDITVSTDVSGDLVGAAVGAAVGLV